MVSAATMPAGLLEVGEFERDRGANDGFLPIVSNGKPPHPCLPIVARAIGEFAARRAHIGDERLVWAEHHVDRLGQDERCFPVDVSEGRVGGEPQHEVLASEADVIAAERALGNRMPIVAGRPDANCYARQPCNRLDDANELRRAKNPVEVAEARCKVSDADRGIFIVGQNGGDDRGVALVVGRKVHHAVENDVAKPLLLIAGQQAGENRIAVKTGITPPHQPRCRLEQSCSAAVADDGEVQPEIVVSA